MASTDTMKCECDAMVSLYFSKRLNRYVCPECQEKQIEMLSNPKKYPLEVGLEASKNDGGPAFPSEQKHIQGGEWTQTYEPGMSLRAYFAGQVVKALTQAWFMGDKDEIDSPDEGAWDLITTAAVKGADAMLAKLKE